jgi:hypothetical protein
MLVGVSKDIITKPKAPANGERPRAAKVNLNTADSYYYKGLYYFDIHSRVVNPLIDRSPMLIFAAVEQVAPYRPRKTDTKRPSEVWRAVALEDHFATWRWNMGIYR